jgi:hypothetical protein
MRKLMGLMLLGAVVALAGCNTPSDSTIPNPKPVHLFLLAGQSNMAGRGAVTPDRQQPIPGVYALQQDGSWAPALDPIHWDKQVAGVGLARSFAREYLARNPGVEIGFIPAACGGSPLEVWVPGAYFEPTQSHPYDDAITRVEAVRHRGELHGILWHQGEADSHPGRSDRYEQRLRELVQRFRDDLGESELPIVFGQLGEFPGKPWTPDRYKVDAMHRRLAYEDNWIAFASAKGLTSKSDLVHFDAAGLDELGRRYAEAWARMVADNAR